MDLSNPISAIIPSLEGQVLRVLGHTTAPLSGSRIAELVATGSNPGVRSALNRLVLHGTVSARRSGPSIMYTANREHLLWPVIEAVVQATDDVMGDLEERIIAVFEKCFGRSGARHTTLALFGSVARFSSTLESDIDIVAIFADDVSSHLIEQFVGDLTSEVERWTGNECNVFDLSSARLAEMVSSRDPMVASWQADSRTFHGPELRRRILDS
ncbi:nucleotidyltransferase domain-containing protein [Glaciibacter superstes]|uniref:nucleotidyltransferase domain-containing protein n=1 Tax=Glaciibacter superstes TaxID=501023 RepID=UPI0003B3F1B5|nr:nucleotidyltransferase domain-containing protein [Glaciibacter superstes]